MESLSCAVLNGGASETSAAFIMQVPKDYDCAHPVHDAIHVRDALGLPEDTLGMMTAAEVDYVFNLKECSYEGVDSAAFATAGLSNHVIAGEELRDYPENSAVSRRRAEEMRAGTINVGIVSSVPLTMEGKVNLFIPLVEAKAVAMAEHGFRETGTTSDAMAVISPKGDDGISWTGTGSKIGIASARAVSAAVGYALDIRNEHPIPLTPEKILGRMGLDAGKLLRMSGSGMDPETYAERLGALLSDGRVRSLMDLAWFVADRADSTADDGNGGESEMIVSEASRIIGAEAPGEGSLMDRIVTMISKKAGGCRWRAAPSRRWCRSSPSGSRTSPRRTWTPWTPSSIWPRWWGR